MSSSDQKPDVEIFHRANKLKAKVGGNPHSNTEGKISPEAIAKADALIQNFCKDCPAMMSEALYKLSSQWKVMKISQNSEERKDIAQKIFTQAHEVKDVAGTCGYHLMADFGESLRDYIVKTELNVDAHRIIIQAHIDAMAAAFRDNIKESENQAAEDLKKAVRIAIEKFS